MLDALISLPLAPPSQVQIKSKDVHMQEAENDHNKSYTALEVTTSHTKKIGIIYPPPDMRKIVDKTASIAAKNGPDFEKRIIIENAGNPKFNFLNSSHPYHAYYQHRPHAPAPGPTPLSKVNDLTEKTNTRRVLNPPEDEKYTIRLPEGVTVTGEELDIIKLTAQFVAVNGDSFLSGLTSRENKNLTFNFSKPTHSLFMIFKSLKDAYCKVLMPGNGLTDMLKENSKDVTTVLDRCLHRLEWEHSQKQARQKDEDENEEERLAMSRIDWHDFVVVENLEDFVNDEEIVEEEKEMKVVENWKRPEDRPPAERNLTKHVISPFTGELIPDNEISQHVRFSLIDPKYKEQKERMFAKMTETTLSHGDEITRNIDCFARTRPDICGTTEEEFSNAVNAKITEDQIAGLNGENNLFGPAASLPRHGFALNQPRVLPNSQYSAVTSRGFVSPPPRPVANTMVVPVNLPQPPMLMIHGHFTPHPTPVINTMVRPPLPEEPKTKKQRLEDSSLISEDQFLTQHQGAVRVSISMPNVDDGNLKGQVLDIHVPFLSETVGSLKEKIAKEIEVPATKQKLHGKAGFMKDDLSLAYYNVGDGDMLFLSLKRTRW